jgi:hypothetical protein
MSPASVAEDAVGGINGAVAIDAKIAHAGKTATFWAGNVEGTSIQKPVSVSGGFWSRLELR